MRIGVLGFVVLLIFLGASWAYQRKHLAVQPLLDIIDSHRYIQRGKLLECRLIRGAYSKSPVLAGYVLQFQEEKLERVWLLSVKRQSRFLLEFGEYKSGDILFLRGTDWVSLYNTDTPVAQIATLPSYAKHEGSEPVRFAIRQIVYNTGVLPNFVVVISKDFSIEASTLNIKSSRDVVSLIRSHKGVHIKPVPDNLYVLEDGTQVYYTNYRSFALQYEAFNRLEFLSDEHAFVEIYNGTKIDGLGTFYSHILRQYGIEISRLGTVERYSSREADPSCNAIVYLPRLVGLETLNFLKYLFGLTESCVKQGRPSFLLTTGDIVIILNKSGF